MPVKAREYYTSEMRPCEFLHTVVHHGAVRWFLKLGNIQSSLSPSRNWGATNQEVPLFLEHPDPKPIRKRETVDQGSRATGEKSGDHKVKLGYQLVDKEAKV